MAAAVVVQMNAGHEFGVVEVAVESAGDLVSVGSDDDSFSADSADWACWAAACVGVAVDSVVADA